MNNRSQFHFSKRKTCPHIFSPVFQFVYVKSARRDAYLSAFTHVHSAPNTLATSAGLSYFFQINYGLFSPRVNSFLAIPPCSPESSFNPEKGLRELAVI